MLRLFYVSIAVHLFCFSISATDTTALTERQKIIHVLNRLGYGPRPGDVEKVEKMGLDNYLQLQLHPKKIDDSALEEKLVDFDVLKMSPSELMTDYYAEIRRFIEQQRRTGEMSEELKLRYGIEVGKDATKTTGSHGGDVEHDASTTPAGKMADLLKELPKRTSLRAAGELQAAKIVRAVESERQLEEVLVDFWGNHFNIDVKKAACRVLKVIDERDVIRPHIFGKFRDLLEASAKSPAMLFYLDNVENSMPRELSVFEQRMRAAGAKKLVGVEDAGMMSPDMKPRMEGGLNENYGREILELHTLGVDGGYDQKDVIEVARCFTGWGYNPLTGVFSFDPRRHDPGEKRVLGHAIPAGGGMKDGEQVLDIIAAHPSTANFISRKLCQRLIADEPPAELVARTAKVFTESGGNLRKVVESIITSPEFFSPAAYRGKIKSPFEFAVSSVRAMNGHVASTGFTEMLKARSALEGSATIGYGQEFVSAQKKKSLNWSIYEMGQPLYAYQAPTGYSEDSRKWVSSGALIARLNFALALTGRTISDALVTPDNLMDGADGDQPGRVIDHLAAGLVQGELSDATRRVLEKRAQSHGDGQSGTVNVAQLTALVLGSPEFQRH